LLCKRISDQSMQVY